MTPSDVKELLGLADNCTAQINSVGNDCYRVNIYQKIKKEGSFMVTSSMVKSYYIRFDGTKYIDETISNKNKPKDFWS